MSDKKIDKAANIEKVVEELILKEETGTPVERKLTRALQKLAADEVAFLTERLEWHCCGGAMPTVEWTKSPSEAGFYWMHAGFTINSSRSESGIPRGLYLAEFTASSSAVYLVNMYNRHFEERLASLHDLDEAEARWLRIEPPPAPKREDEG